MTDSGREPLRTLCLFLGVLYLACSAGCEFSAPPKPRRNYPVYASFRDIPGVTPEETAAVEKLQRDGHSFIFGMNPSTEAFYDENGDISGYSALLCGWLSGLFSMPFKMALYEWEDLIAGLKSHEIAFTGEMSPTEERRAAYFMTDAIAERTIKFMRIAGSEPLLEIEKQRPARYAFLEGTTTRGLVSPFLRAGSGAAFVSNYTEAYRLLKNGEVDAFLDESPAEAAFDAHTDVTVEDFFPLQYSPVSLTTQNPELAPVVSIVQKALRGGGTYHLTQLYKQGYAAYSRHKIFMHLDSAEKEYIRERAASGRAIPLAAEYDNYPSSFYNEQEKEWQGIAHDVLGEIEKLTGLVFRPVHGERLEWQTLLDMLARGEAAMITELVPSRNRRGRFLWPQNSCQIDHYALLSTAGAPDIMPNEILYAKVGMIEGSGPAAMFRAWFPDHGHTVEYANNFEAFNALELGEIDFLMATHNHLLNVTNFLERPNFKANILFRRSYESSFGFNLDETVLRSIVDKSLRMIDTQGIVQRWMHRVFDYRLKITQAKEPWLIGALVLLLCVLALLAFMLLKGRQAEKRLEMTVHERTGRLAAQAEAARAASRDARLASRAKSEFLARMSHEIRTPLNAIIGMTEIAKRARPPENIIASLSEIQIASNHLLGIINDILDMSKIESGKLSLTLGNFSFHGAMEEIRHIMMPRCLDKHIRFITEFTGFSGYEQVRGDKLRLKQVLINLIGNAVKFTPSGGKIRFLLHGRETGEKRIAVDFSVLDTGIGMKEAQMRKLFTTFEQTDAQIATRFGGTGLGLAISQKLVRMMGGLITARSVFGEGSAFSFTLDMELSGYAAADGEVSDVSALELRGRRILLVEDVDINRLILTELLADTHASIDEAVDGLQALKKFDASPERHYDLIFMDIQMPNMDGYEATRRIRALNRADAAAVPIIAMTANAYNDDIEQSLAAGMNAHLAKPIDIQAVMRLLRERLGRRQDAVT